MEDFLIYCASCYVGTLLFKVCILIGFAKPLTNDEKDGFIIGFVLFPVTIWVYLVVILSDLQGYFNEANP